MGELTGGEGEDLNVVQVLLYQVYSNASYVHKPDGYASGLMNVVVKVEKTCDATMIPRLIPQSKGFTEDLSSTWTVDQVFSVTRSRDSVNRRACVKYCYHTEERPRY